MDESLDAGVSRELDELRSELTSTKERSPEEYARFVGNELSTALSRLATQDKRMWMSGHRILDELTPHVEEVSKDPQMASEFTKELAKRLRERAKFLEE